MPELLARRRALRRALARRLPRLADPLALLVFRAAMVVLATAASYAAWRLGRKTVAEWLPLGTPLLVILAVGEIAVLLIAVEAVAPSVLDRPGRALRLFVAWVVGALVALALAEGATRLLEPPQAVSYLVWPPGMTARFHPDPAVFPGIRYDETGFRTNRDGLRGREPSSHDRLRVLALGGSTTEELYLDDRDAWPAVLERTLAARDVPGPFVEGAGKSGLDSAHHVVLLRTVGAELRPDVTVGLVGINDLALALRQDFRGIEWDYGLHQFWSARAPLVAEGAFQRTGLRTYWAWLRVSAFLPWARADRLVQDDTGRDYERFRERRRRAESVDEVPPDFARGLDAYSSRLRELAGAARAIGTRLVLLTQPSLLKPVMVERERAMLMFGRRAYDDRFYYSPAALARMLDAYNAVTLAVCAEERLDCFDLAARVPKDLEHFYDDVHFNTAGSRLVGALVGEFLARDVLPRPR